VWPLSSRTDQTLELLLHYGGNPSVQNNRKNTAMHLACERYVCLIVSFFSVLRLSPLGSSFALLPSALCSTRHVKIRLLLKYGADFTRESTAT
jgi:hypothetical protein